MRQLWLFLSKYHVLFLFLFLEAIGFGLLFTRSNYQRAKFLKSTGLIQTSLAKQRHSVTDYLQLKQKNKLLAQENQKLRQQLAGFQNGRLQPDSLIVDSTMQSNYSFKAAKVVTNEMRGGYNHITIALGAKDSVTIGDGVIAEGGTVGKIVKTSKRYSLVMPLFNRNMRLNVQHKASEYNGDLVWKGSNFNFVQVENISRNANIELGDTIVTHLSNSLPDYTPVGVVEKSRFDVQGNFYLLDIRPLADFRKLNYVYVVKRKDMAEIQNLNSSDE